MSSPDHRNASDQGPNALGEGNGVGWGDNLVRANSEPLPLRPDWAKTKSIRHKVTLSERKFDINTLPVDLLRVYRQLEEKHNEEYALIFVFTVRTAIELHRAWHLTLLSSKILQSIKDRFNMRMTWNLGVIKLIFRVDDGAYELHRKVPYDYDSEYQDLYMKIAVALVEGHITIHQALIFQAETKQGLHTARSGLFLRDAPGRLILYPLEAATCTVIFFGGDWEDAGVAAICGLAAGLVEYFLTWMGGDAKVLTDVLVGVSTGLIAGFFYRFDGPTYCVSSIFLGTLYWFFYGTAFVIGILEIIAGELETGVTRFIAVSVKTFVLTLGSCIGLLISLYANLQETWVAQNENCGNVDLDEKWWRIPLYLLCSASALGQYRVPIVHYWRGLVIQLVGYEVQYQMFKYFALRHERDFLDTAVSNIAGAAAAVLAASTLSYIVDQLGYYYNGRLLQRDIGKRKRLGDVVYRMIACFVRVWNKIGLGRKSSVLFLEMEKRLQEQTRDLMDPNHPLNEIKLLPEEEVILVEAIVDAENLNIWSLLMPAVYQLVPGSLIARLWYNAVFPPPLVANQGQLNVTGTLVNYTDMAANPEADDVFYGLWVISTSLALGLIVGFAVVQVSARLLRVVTSKLNCAKDSETTEIEEALEKERIKRLQFRQQGVMATAEADDPDGDENEPILTRDGSRPDAPILGQDRIARLVDALEGMESVPEDEERQAADVDGSK